MGRPWPTHMMMMMIVVLDLVCIIPTMVYSSSSYRVHSDDNTEELRGFRVNMRYIDDHESSLIKRSQSAVERSKRRAGSIAEVVRQKQMETFGNVKAAGDFQSPVHVGNGQFLIEVGYGSPGVLSQGVLDTGSDLIWTQCQPCTKCYEQSVPFYAPSKSSTSAKVGCTDSFCTSAFGPGEARCSSSKACTYALSYSDGGSSKGSLIYDTLTLGKDTKVSNVSFGCSTDNTVGAAFTGKVSGVVGMGRGPLSLVSQLGSKMGKRFSYCLLSFAKYFGTGADKTSPLLFGEDAKLSGAGKVQTMTFVKNDQLPLFYYIPLTGIAVGGKAVNIPAGTFDVKSDGSGGVIIDSGTTLTQLAQAAYTPLADAIKAGISAKPVDGSSVGLDLCYAVKAKSGSLKVPSLAFNFQGGLIYEFPTDNYFQQASDELFCLAAIPLPSSSTSPSVLGSIAQQNFHVLYDNDANTLSFQPAACDSL